jgi:hypothetical protein
MMELEPSEMDDFFRERLCQVLAEEFPEKTEAFSEKELDGFIKERRVREVTWTYPTSLFAFTHVSRNPSPNETTALADV